MKLLKVRGATLLNWSDFLLQKLQSYGEVSNVREATPPISATYVYYFIWFVSCMHVPTGMFHEI